MSSPANFGDPSFEPSDEQLQDLSREAFADVGARWEVARTRLREEIARLRAEAIARVNKAAGT